MRISRTKIRRRDGKLVVDLPMYVLPEVRREMTRFFEPAIEVQSVDYLLLRTGGMERGTGRIPVHIPSWILNQLGMDATKRIQLRLYRYPVLFQSHFYHGLPSGRAWLPREAINRFNLQPHTEYSFQIRGWTPELEKERMEETREIRINHLNREHRTTSRVWTLPEVTGSYMGRVVEPESLFGWAIDQGFNVVAEWYYDNIPGLITVEFIAEPKNRNMEYSVSTFNNLAFRNMSVRNFSVEDTMEYRFLTEIRATFLSAYPRILYDATDVNWQTMLIEALNTTTYNLATYLLYIGESDKLSESRESIRVSSEGVKKGNILPPKTSEIITEGTEINTPIDAAKIEGYFQYANKYIRIVDSKDKYWEYATNQKIESLVFINDNLTIGEKGFVWKAIK